MAPVLNAQAGQVRARKLTPLPVLSYVFHVQKLLNVPHWKCPGHLCLSL